MSKRNILLLAGVFVLTAVVALAPACRDDSSSSSSSGGDTIFTSRAYKGHARDTDMNLFAKTYPSVYGTRLDDCQTCHGGGTVTDDQGDPVDTDPCSFCHYIVHPPAGWTDLPNGWEDTLNLFGLAYKMNGRDAGALSAIEGDDSDGDSYTNLEEILDLKFPGNPGSMPGQTVCPAVEVTLTEIDNDAAITKHSQFTFANTNKQQYDFYANYRGVKIKDLVNVYGGLDLDVVSGASIDSIQIIAPDGYRRTFTIEQVRDQFDDHYYYSGLGVGDLGATCSFVEYPSNTNSLADGETIPFDQWHIIAYEREGLSLESAYLDPTSGKIVGEGPFRNVIPPYDMNPLGGDSCNRVDPQDPDFIYAPDWGKYTDGSGCSIDEIYPYLSCKSHNAGDMIKAAVIIKVEPMPAGCEEFDVKNSGWSLIEDEKIMIYGYGINTP